MKRKEQNSICANNICQLREFYGLTQTDLADRLSVMYKLKYGIEKKYVKSTISQYENASSCPHRDELEFICYIFDISEYELFNSKIDLNGLKLKEIKEFPEPFYRNRIYFPFIDDCGINNENFNMACTLHKKIFSLEEINPDSLINMIEKCIKLYFESINDGIICSKINIVSIYSFLFLKLKGNQQLEKVSGKIDDYIDTNDFFHKKTIELLEDLYIFKFDEEYSEYSEYYFAMSFYWHLLPDEFIKHQEEFGNFYMKFLRRMDNKFIKDYIKFNNR